MNNTRHPDYPEYKEQVMSTLFGEFVSFLKNKGLTKGKEFEIRIDEFFQCSKKILWIDQYSSDLQITICLNSIQMSCEFGVVKRKDGEVTKDVIHRNKIENLRYKISPGTQIELIDSHQIEFDNFFSDFKKHFSILESSALKNNGI